MPAATLKGLAEKHGVSLSLLETWWSEARAEYGDDYKAVMGTVMKRLRAHKAAHRSQLSRQ